MVKLSISGVWPGLPDAIALQLIASAASRSLKAGAVLFETGDAADGCYRLDQGLLKVSLASPHGDERIIAILSAGAIVGDLAMIDGQPRSATVVALTDCDVRFVSRSTFQAILERNPELNAFLVQVLCRRLRETDDTIAALAFLSARGRVAHALLEVGDVAGKRLDAGLILLPNFISQKDLAALAGVARENTNRILREFQRRKLLIKTAEGYRIDDPEKLAREMDDDVNTRVRQGVLSNLKRLQLR